MTCYWLLLDVFRNILIFKKCFCDELGNSDLFYDEQAL